MNKEACKICKYCSYETSRDSIKFKVCKFNPMVWTKYGFQYVEIKDDGGWCGRWVVFDNATEEMLDNELQKVLSCKASDVYGNSLRDVAGVVTCGDLVNYVGGKRSRLSDVGGKAALNDTGYNKFTDINLNVLTGKLTYQYIWGLYNYE